MTRARKVTNAESESTGAPGLEWRPDRQSRRLSIRLGPTAAWRASDRDHSRRGRGHQPKPANGSSIRFCASTNWRMSATTRRWGRSRAAIPAWSSWTANWCARAVARPPRDKRGDRERRARAAQKEGFDRLLGNHLLYCTVCDNNNGNCEVHNTTALLDIEHQTHPYKPKPYPCDFTNPFYRYDPDQCILCGRCVEACQTVQVNETLSIDWEDRPIRECCGMAAIRSAGQAACAAAIASRSAPATH